jgi:hypothetical protein
MESIAGEFGGVSERMRKNIFLDNAFIFSSRWKGSGIRRSLYSPFRHNQRGAVQVPSM